MASQQDEDWVKVPTRRRERLDSALFERGMMRSRAQARDAVLRGAVMVAGQIATKPAAKVAPDADITLDANRTGHVSRGGLKLAAALDGFGFDALGRVCLDVGASTGGFTEVLLARGARQVYAVDVGHGQLHETLLSDERVVSLEGTDVRELSSLPTGGPICKPSLVPMGAIVADVSFISLTQALGAALKFAGPGAWLVALIKPQFELGRGGVGKGGIVRDPALRAEAVTKVRDWLAMQSGWHQVGVLPSSIAGAGGNQEFLIGATNDR